MSKSYYELAISFGNMYRALKKSCKNVRWKDSVINHEANALKRTYLLKRNLEKGSYKISKYQVFRIFEPKERIIKAARIVDRQFQRSLCDSGLYDDITEHFVDENVACQLGKGTSYAHKLLKKQLREYYSKYGADGWVLKCDIHHYFQEIPHDKLIAKLTNYIEDKDALQRVMDVIDSYDE